jgi:hypothetical protein
MASTYLSRTQSTPTNAKKWTISYWGRYNLTNNNWYPTFGCDYDNGDSYFGIGSGGQGRNEIGLLEYHTSSTNYGQGYTASSLRDSSAWYHIVFAYDSTQSTASDRGKTYINGVQQTNTYSTDIPQNHDSRFNMSGSAISIGRRSAGSGQYMEAILSHFHFIDGTAYDASAFGETDTATGIWKPKTAPVVTYGTNGFFLKFENSASFGTDSSGNANNFTVNGTMTQTIDTPSNVFATLNPLYGNGSYSFEHGNNSLEGNNTNNWGITVPATLGATSGKYYWEVKQVAGSHTDYNLFGFIQTDYIYTGSNLISTAYLNGIQTNALATVAVYNGANATTYLAIGGSQVSVSDNDIVSFALDLDNQKCWIAKNGVWSDDLNGNVGNPSTGANALWTSSVIPSGQIYSPVSIQYYDPKCQYNFGNGYFGTTAVSSAENPDDGIGIFEYEVPSRLQSTLHKIN